VKVLSPLPRVLYVEDSAVNARLMSQVFARFRPDLSLVIAPNGESGLQLVESLRPVLLLLDYHLPDTTGLEVLNTIRDRGFTIPVIVVTADARSEFAVAVMTAGANAVLTKPFEFAAVLEAIAQLLPRLADAQ
jgi:CheY-like chemotaxis protein